jgi:hypothetical protein
MTLEELKLENEKLKAQLEDMERRTLIVIRQCDEWAKSYDRLLKDFIHYRKTN